MNNTTPYITKPVETSDVELPDELLCLVEQLSRDVHNAWAAGRLNDGWTYGPERNDALKQHPCLVDYNDLSEEEKDFDRQTVMETLRKILKLGWYISKNN